MNRLNKSFLLASAIAMMAEGVHQSAAEAVTLGETGRVVSVHKKDAEGSLLIDAGTGKVLSNQPDRPEWADGLVMAMLGERHIFYAARLGQEGYTPAMRNPDAYAFEDLAWMALNMEDGAEQTVQADDEFRMDVIAEVYGIDRSTEDGAVALAGIRASHEISLDSKRTDEAAKAFTSAQEQGFDKVAHAGAEPEDLNEKRAASAG